MSENKFTLHADMSDYPDKVAAISESFAESPQFDSKERTIVDPVVQDEPLFLHSGTLQPLTNIHEIPTYVPPVEALIAREFAIKSDRLSISVFNSLDTWPADAPVYEGLSFDPVDAYGFTSNDMFSKLTLNKDSYIGPRNRGFIEFQMMFIPETVIDSSKNEIANWIRPSIEKSLSSENRAALWDLVEKASVEEEVQERFPGLDIKVLTPFQASYLAYSILKNNFNYDFTAVSNGINRLSGDDLTKARELLDTSPDAYAMFVKDRSTYLDSLDVVELLNEGKGVCRHAALISTVLYEVIKSRQESIMLNGTYMLYVGSNSDVYTTNYRERRVFNEIPEHAFNAFVRMHPNQTSDINIDISVLDPTLALKEDNISALDYTGDRITTSAAVLRKLSQKFDIPSDQLSTLLDEYFTRVKEVPTNVVAFSDYIGARFAQRIAAEGNLETGAVLEILDDTLNTLDSNALLRVFNHIHNMPYFTQSKDGVTSSVDASTASILYKQLAESKALSALSPNNLSTDVCLNIERDFIKYPMLDNVSKVAVDMVLTGRELMHTPFVAKLTEIAENYYDVSNPDNERVKRVLHDVNFEGLLERANLEVTKFRVLNSMTEEEFAYRYQVLQLAAANLPDEEHSLFVDTNIKRWITKNNAEHMQKLLSDLHLNITN